MKLKKYQIDKLIKDIQNSFKMDYAQAEEIVESFDNLLENNNTKFIYDLNYTIFHRRNHKFTKQILNMIVDTYAYLFEEASDDMERKIIRSYFEKLFDVVFIDRCQYSKQLEEKSKTTQKILQHTTKRLNETLETQELMIANISHEMRTSLNAINGYLAIISDKDVLQGEDKQYLSKATHATRTLKELVSDILSVTKLNSGQLEIQQSNFWLDKMLIKCIDNIALMLQKKPKLHLRTDIEFVPFRVYGDQNHIMEIIINILSNAVKYTDSGYISLSMKTKQTSDNNVAISFVIADTGIGMTSQQLETIFSPYSRFKTERQGLGLGMHIAHQLAKKLNGNLTVESVFGKGSIFKFDIDMKIADDKKLDIKSRNICILNKKNYNDTYKQRISFLEEQGANVKVFDNENEFINYLLTIQDNVPEYVSIIATIEGYTKFDALIYYLKTLPIFAKTIFIAENYHQHISLNYFDEIYEYFAPIDLYARNKTQDLQKFESRVDISILAIDDTETNLDILSLFISKKYPNITLDLANGGYEGIGMFKIKKYDMVMLDLKMPGLDGFEVFNKLKELGSPLPPVYAFSADIYKSNIDKVEEYGFAGMIEKPLQPQKLYKIIERIMHESNN